MTLSPAAKKLSDAAILHFAERGYEAASLTTVADAVGIRKATIYSHFKGKDELFLHVYHEALATERAFMADCFSQQGAAGERYLTTLPERYGSSAHLKLLLRTAFVPPQPVRAEVVKGYEEFTALIKARFVAATPMSGEKVEIFADAYLGIIDSLYIELLYASEQAAEKRLAAMWHVFTTAMRAS